MSSTVQAPIPGVRRRPIPWFVISVVSALALIAAAVVVLDDGSDSTVHRSSTGQAVNPAQATTPVQTPTVCGSEYGSLFAVMNYAGPDAAARITPVLSEKTWAGIHDMALVVETVNVVPQYPDPVTLALALGRLTPAESAAIVAELPPATRDAVANVELDATLVGAVCP